MTQVNESCHIWMSYRQTLAQPSWVVRHVTHIFEQNMAHIWMSCIQSVNQHLRDMSRIEQTSHGTCMKGSYGVASISRLLWIIGLFCRISSLLEGSFAKETYHFKEPTNRSHPIPCLFERVKAHIWMRHGKHKWVMSFIFEWAKPHAYECVTRHAYKCVTPHAWSSKLICIWSGCP